MKTLSIITICHNDVSHLKNYFEMLNPQLNEQVTHLFVDDASTDGSFELAKALSKGTVIQNPTRRDVGGARNAGIEYLRSLVQPPDYVWFHDCDDQIPPSSVERILKLLDSDVDCISIPVATLRKSPNGPSLLKSAVAATDINSAPGTPVGTWSKVIKLTKYVPQAENQMCEHVAWHYRQFDQFDTWTKVEGEEPCYIWDRTNDKAISETVDFCNANSNTIEGLAFSNILVQRGLKDKWVSDNLRNLANMYDVRHELKRPAVKQAWANRFRAECTSMLGGHHVH